MRLTPKPLVLAVALASSASGQIAAEPAPDSAGQVRAIERRRLAALLAGDIAAARRLHADDFQLVSPFGDTLTRDEYLAPLAAGIFRYVLWEPGPIAVRAHGDSAIVRYQARAVVAVRGQAQPEHRYWHTDYYERRSGRWQVVWSQATQVAEQ